MRNKKKILFVSQHFYPEGFRINDLVDGLVERGHSVSVLCGLPNYPKGEWFQGYSAKGPYRELYRGAEVHRAYEIPRKGNTSIRIFLNYISWPLFSSMKALKLKGDYDVVVCYNTSPVMMLLPAIVIAKRKRIPMIGYILDIWPENLYTVLPVGSSILRKIAQKVSDKLYSKADCLVSMSDSLKTNIERRELVRNKGIPVHVLPQHAEDFYANARNQSSSKENDNCQCTIVFAGNISPAQGLDNAIDAIVIYSEKYDRELRLIIVGDGMEKKAIEDQVSKQGVADMVHFVGRVKPEEVPDYYRAADALLVPFSRNEHLALTVPAKVASCMASGKPILGYLEGEGKKAIEDAKCGLVCEPGNPEKFAQLIREFQITSDTDKKKMGDNSFNYYSKNYSREIILDRLEDIILKAKRQPHF